jgi:hypothetical protein
VTPIPLAGLRLSPRSHASAMWWLGLLYRRPQRFKEVLAELPKRRQGVAACVLLLHVLPYLLVVAVVGRGLLSWVGIASGITSGITSWITYGITYGITLGIAGGVAAGILIGIAFGTTVGIAGGVAAGITSGIAFGIAGGAGGIGFGVAAGIFCGNMFRLGAGIGEGILFRFAAGIGFAILMGILIGIGEGIAPGILVGIGEGITFGIAVWIAFVAAFGIALFRAYYHPVHLWFVWPVVHGCWYPRHPAAWDDLCALPFPGLGRLLVAYAEVAPATAEAEIERLIDTYPSQRHQALIARTILLARAAAAETRLGRLDQMVAALPEGDKGFLAQTAQVKAGVGEIAALQRQLDTMTRPAFREPVAGQLTARIETFAHRIAGFAQPLASEFRRAAASWLAIAQRQHDEAKCRVTREATPQVFRAGEPVKRDIEAFVPRMPIIEQLEGQIMLATGCPGLLVGGRRRMGKSTLIRNLIGFIPDTVKVVPISMLTARAHASLAHLCELLEAEIGAATGLKPPPPSDSPPLVRLFDRLTDTDQALAAREQRLLLAIDEFEKIDAKIGEGVFPTDLLSTVRESIQSHRRIIWAFVGSYDLTELTHAAWSSYFVSLRSIKVLPFTPGETRRLLTEPLAQSRLWQAHGKTAPHFDPGFWGDGGIERIHTEAGGWPHLVQLLAETAVELANDRQLDALGEVALEEAADQAVGRGTVVLSELIEGECRTPAEWQYLLRFRAAETQPPPADEQVRRSLCRRLLVLDEGAERWRLRVPLMRRWLIKQA